MEIEQLVEGSEFVGGIYDMDYSTCYVHTTDYIKKVHCGGLQRHAFLIAKMEPGNITTELGDPGESMLRKHALLLRVSGPAELPTEAELVGARYQNIEEKVVEELDDQRDSFDIDAITRGKIQKTAIEAEIIGTFYDDGKIRFGGDVHSVFPSGEYFVYKPTGDELQWISTFMQPEVRAEEPPTINIGHVKYSASNLRKDTEEDSVVAINAKDLVGNKTALFGMTRTGKSNTMKVLATAVHLAQDDVGQLIFDPSGEYGNPNEQDRDYALIQIGEGVKKVSNDDDADISLKTNFFNAENISFAHNEAARIIRQEQLGDVSGYLQSFIDSDIDHPENLEPEDFTNDDDGPNIHQVTKRYERRASAFYATLIKGGLKPPSDFDTNFSMKKSIREIVFSNNDKWETIDIEDDDKFGIKLDGEWCGQVDTSKGNVWLNDTAAIREFWEEVARLSRSDDEVESWVGDDLGYILGVLIPEQASWRGANIFTGLRPHHDPSSEDKIEEKIYELLSKGQTVIVDLSEGDENVNRQRAKRFVKSVLSTSVHIFIQNQRPPDIQIYLEEAHRYFNEDRFKDDSYDPYVRLAKEGAKYNLGLVYATQEVSTVDDRVLANTANWVVTHLNNKNEIGELTDYYDFESYEDSIRNVTEQGLARIRFLSNEYTIPIKVEEFTEEWVGKIKEAT